MPSQPSRAMQDYLKALHRLGGEEALVSPLELAAQLQVRSASVTDMLKRLAEGGWIEYEAGRGARLTPQGIAEARRVIRRHRLLELFLARVLGLDWSEVDAEADALEHVISPRLEQAIAAHLGEPLEDPHGHPIPTASGDLARRQLRPLDQFAPGQRILIREAQDDRAEYLRRWQDLGLVPGTLVTLLRHHPLDGVFELQVGERVLSLAAEGLRGLWGEPVPAEPAPSQPTPPEEGRQEIR
jgi:DtxR family Mn-dependent transcriptional regulator